MIYLGLVFHYCFNWFISLRLELIKIYDVEKTSKFDDLTPKYVWNLDSIV